MSLFREQAVRHYVDPDVRGGLLRLEPPSGARLFAALAILFAAAVVIASCGTVDVTARGPGVVRPAAGVRSLEAQVGGRVERIAAAPGEMVAEGALLFTIAEPSTASRPAEEPLADLIAKQRAHAALLEQSGDERGAALVRAQIAELEREAERLTERPRPSPAREVRAPLAGRLDALAVREGDLVRPGTPLAKLVPEGGPLVARMALPAEHRAAVAPGREVRLALDEHPPEEAGFASARVTRISADPIGGPGADPLLAELRRDPGPAFLLELELEAMPPRARGAFRNGMTFRGAIVLREERILTALFPPLGRLLFEPAVAE